MLVEGIFLFRPAAPRARARLGGPFAYRARETDAVSCMLLRNVFAGALVLAKGAEGMRRAIVTVVGFACLYAVATVFFYYDWLYELPFETDEFLYEVFLNASLCIAAVVVALLMRFADVVKPIAYAGTAGYAAALVLLFFAGQTGAGEALVYAAGVCAGIGSGTLIPLWFMRIGETGSRGFGYVLGAGSLLSGVIMLAENALPIASMIVSCAVLLAVSLVAFARLERVSSRVSDEGIFDQGAVERRKGIFASLAAPLVYVFFLSIIYGALDVVMAVSGPVPTSDSGTIFQGTSIVTNMFFLLYVRFGRGRYASLLNICLGIIATGLIFFPFFPSGYGMALVVFVHAGWEIALLVSYALVIELLSGNRRGIVAGAAAVFAFPRPGVVLGSGIATLVAVDNQFAFTQLAMVACSLLYLIVVGVLFIRTREKRAADRAIRKRDEIIDRYIKARDDLRSLACDELAQAHGLTKRETEMLHLLSQGRDAAYIGEAMFLSRNTVKSYSKSIYAKLDVHSKQELIDLVNDAAPY